MKGRRALLWARRLTQLSFLGLFFYLFRLTDYTGKDQIAAAVNIWIPSDTVSSRSTSTRKTSGSNPSRRARTK